MRAHAAMRSTGKAALTLPFGDVLLQAHPAQLMDRHLREECGRGRAHDPAYRARKPQWLLCGTSALARMHVGALAVTLHLLKAMDLLRFIAVALIVCHGSARAQAAGADRVAPTAATAATAIAAAATSAAAASAAATAVATPVLATLIAVCLLMIVRCKALDPAPCPGSA